MAEALENLNVFQDTVAETEEAVLVGIDEAGRGPVVGPMVYCAFVMPVCQKTLYKDSKLLTPAARDSFFKNIGENYAMAILDPVYITTHMECGTKNLNEIAREAVVKLLRMIEKKCKNVITVYVDALGNNDQYGIFLAKKFPFEFVVENHADSKYSVVGGASIVAKVTRDRIVREYNCGSGYPSDPITVKWLRECKRTFFGFPAIVRHSWRPIKEKLERKRSAGFPGELSGFYISYE